MCVAAMLASAAVEWRRLQLFREGDILAPAAEAAVMHWGARGRHEAAIVNMNVFWQVPQYLLIGLSEVSTRGLGAEAALIHHGALRLLL